MELKYQEIEAGFTALHRLIQQELPVKYNVPLIKLYKALKAHAETINEAKTSIAKRYGEPMGTGYSVPEKDEHGLPNPNYIPAFTELNELMKMTAELNFDTVTLPEKINGKNIPISAASMIDLEPFVNITEDVPD